MPDLSRSLPFSAPSPRKFAPARRWPALSLLAIAMALAPAAAQAAGGAFVVDDAEVGKPGECKVESWAQFGSNHDMAVIAQPACVINAGIPVELGGAIARTRSADEWSTSAGPKAKVNLLPIETGRVGVGLAGMAGWDLGTGQYLGQLLYVPLTLQLRDDFRININGGWQYDAAARLSYAYWGAAFEWTFMQPLTLIGEVFGLAGPTSDPTTITTPRAQLGLRLTPVSSTDIDLIYGYNLGGENAHWVTIGLNLRF